MDIFGLITMIGGLALFLYGMSVMGDSLSKLSGGKLESLLEKLTSNKIRAVILGAFVTAVIQSSSATTVMVVGFVNSGIMQLGQSVGIIMGANIGTTITSWLLSLTGISGDNPFIQMLKPSSFSPILAAIGVIMTMSAKKNHRKKDIGTILLGFAILMFGMETMSGAVAPLANEPKFTGILTMFSNPILGMAAGAILTAAIQSSSASVGILQALCATGAVSFGAAIPIIMGQNIGTCVTAIISSVGASTNAKRASMIHLYFNLIGTVIFMVVFYGVNSVVDFAFLEHSTNAVGIAIVHSLFNVGCAIVMFPFSNGLLKLANLTIREPEVAEDEDGIALPQELASLDERFLDQPAFAMELCRNVTVTMARDTKECISLALKMINEYNEKEARHILDLEDRLDIFEDVLGSYLVKLSSKDLSTADSRSLSTMLHCTSDLERISDHAANIVESIKEMRDNKQEFTEDGLAELAVLIRAVDDIVDMTIECFVKGDLEMAKKVEPLEEIIDGLNVALRQSHISRLRAGQCTIELGITLEDLITDLERVADHCSNIAVCLIEVDTDKFDTHGYLNATVKTTAEFAEETKRLSEIYRLPLKKGLE